MKYLLLCGESKRARAYAAVLSVSCAAESWGILFYGSKEQVELDSCIDSKTLSYLTDIGVHESIEFTRPIIHYATKCSWFECVNTGEVNDPIILSRIEAIAPRNVIFAGYGGQILSASHFRDGRTYIHCHPGRLPEERGSTTLWYSLLQRRPFFVSVFEMTVAIDDGQLLSFSEYDLPQGLVDVDGVVDHFLRAHALFHFISREREELGNEIRRGIGEDCVYYVIHPVLKHLAAGFKRTEEGNEQSRIG